MARFRLVSKRWKYTASEVGRGCREKDKADEGFPVGASKIVLDPGMGSRVDTSRIGGGGETGRTRWAGRERAAVGGIGGAGGREHGFAAALRANGGFAEGGAGGERLPGVSGGGAEAGAGGAGSGGAGIYVDGAGADLRGAGSRRGALPKRAGSGRGKAAAGGGKPGGVG